MNFAVVSAPDNIAILRTGRGTKQNEVFADLKIARIVVINATETRIRQRKAETQAALLEHRTKTLAKDEIEFKAWRAKRDAVTTIREKDLPVEGNAG